MATPWIYLAGTAATALGGALTTGDAFNSGWYNSLQKPSLTPPAYVFPIVWTFLYIFIFLAGAYTDRAIGFGNGELTTFRVLFALQLILNFLWSYLFFVQRNLGGALIVNLLLVFVNFALLSIMARYSRFSFVLFLLYTLWTLFALYITWSIWSLNR